MRSRNIKPGFFKNEILAELPAETRLLFVGLWCMADRKGRLEDRTKRIKAEIFPYDGSRVGPMLDALEAGGFIRRYKAEGLACIQIENFARHQHPHVKEGESTIPPPPDPKTIVISDIFPCTRQAPDLHQTSTGQAPDKHQTSTSQVRLIPDSPLLITENPKPGLSRVSGWNVSFDLFWRDYPNKVGKGEAEKAWRKIPPGEVGIDKILEAIKSQNDWRKKARNGDFRPAWKNPATWLNQKCWLDVVDGSGTEAQASTAKCHQPAPDPPGKKWQGPPPAEFLQALEKIGKL